MIYNKRGGMKNQYRAEGNAKENTNQKVSFFFHGAKLANSNP